MESAGGPKKCERNSNAKDMFGREGGAFGIAGNMERNT